MNKQSGVLFVILANALVVVSCGSQPPRQEVSDEGRRICEERVAEAPNHQVAMQSLRECLDSIDDELASAKRSPASVPFTPTAPKHDPYIYCHKVRNSVIAAEKRRLQTQPRWIVASRLPSDNPKHIEAKREYDAAMENLNRLVPPEMRGDSPLHPDGVKRFMTCNRDDFYD